jgi:hypothetical protein
MPDQVRHDERTLDSQVIGPNAKFDQPFKI